MIKKYHDTKWVGQSKQRHMKAHLEGSYYWSQMWNEVKIYTITCLACQQNKVEHQKPVELLQPFPTPNAPWESLSMDFIIGFPRSEGCGTIIMVIDRFFKYATFITTPKDYTAEETAQLFFKHIVKYWGLPQSIINDQYSQFTKQFWMKLFKLIGSTLHFFTRFHPQTDGQTKWVNALLQLYL